MTGRWRSRSTTRVSRQGPVKPSMWSRCAGFVLRTGFCRPRSRRSLLGNSRSLTSRHDSGSRRVPCIIGSLKASSRLGAILAGAGACRSPRTLRRRVVNGCSLRCTSNSQPKRALWEVQFEVTVPALEDKIVQRATVEVLNAIYETDFLGFSYGFRPGRSQHNALDALYTGLLTKNVNWVLDVDIRSFFDGLSHAWLVKFVEHRVADRRVVRLIQKWLKCSKARSHSSGCESHRQNRPGTVVVISSGEKGDQLAGSLEVKASVAGITPGQIRTGGERLD